MRNGKILTLVIYVNVSVIHQDNVEVRLKDQC